MRSSIDKKDADMPRIVIVTGLSGAGNSTALAALADSGLYCIDNLPCEMIETVIALRASGRIHADQGLAIGMDVRDSSFAENFPAMKKALSGRVWLETIFLTADEGVITTRFSTTRRRHPLMSLGKTLAEAISEERQLLAPVEEAADAVFDTSTWSPHVLARAIESHFAKALAPRMLHLTITSFGFKYGQHRPVDTMFDVRFLDNPYFVADLKAKSGLDAAVRDYIFATEPAQTMFAKIEDMLRFLLPLYYREGKHYFRLAIGCSGGRHRSVAFAEELGKVLLIRPLENVVTTIIHRDIDQ